MPEMPPTFRPSGQVCRAEQNKGYDDRRGSAASRGYGRPWAKARKGHLSHSPLCVYCEVGAWGQPPRITAATTVDHLYPHKGDTVLFWAKQWWVSTCGDCHSGPKQALERRGPRALDALARLLGLPVRGEGGIKSLEPRPSRPAG